MKKEIGFIGFHTILGALSGLVVALILFTAGGPNPANIVLTHQEKADFERLAKINDLVSTVTAYPIWRPLFMVLGCVSFAWFLSIINPNIGTAFRKRTGVRKAALTVLVLIILLAVPEYFYRSIYVVPVLTALAWFIAGETGWAGNFSSWHLGVQARPAQAATLGALFGLAVLGLLFSLARIGRKYVLLVSEVLDQSGEVSYQGFKLLVWWTTIAGAIGAGVAAALAAALSPTHRKVSERFWLTSVPLVLCVFCAVVVGMNYRSFSQKYDFNKSSLAEAAGIAEKTLPDRTVLLLKSKDDKSQAWPMRTIAGAAASMAEGGTIDISYDNLKMIEDYLARHTDGSLFKYASLEVLAGGYRLLWDVPKSLDWQYKAANEMVLPRHMLIAKLKYLPVTEANARYVNSFADEGKWQTGPKYSLKIAEAFMHFGMQHEAIKWLEKARAVRSDAAKRTFAGPAPITNGVIQGRIIGPDKKPLTGRIGLFRDDGSLKKIDHSTTATRLLDAQDLDNTGGFKFERLGSENYVLAIMTDGATLPQNTSVRVVNSPGTIALSLNNNWRYLKTIGLLVEKKTDSPQ